MEQIEQYAPEQAAIYAAKFENDYMGVFYVYISMVMSQQEWDNTLPIFQNAGIAMPLLTFNKK